MKYVLRILGIIIGFGLCAFGLTKVISNRAVIAEKDEIDIEKITKLCEQYGEDFVFFPGDSKKQKIIQNITFYNGRDYSLVYDPNYYYQNNKDIQEKCACDGKELIKHFVRIGMHEGRKANETFEFSSYFNANPDLREVYGSDISSYYLHYILQGHNEPDRKTLGVTQLVSPVTKYNNIDYKKVYDYKYYTNKYPEIKEMCTLPGITGCVNDVMVLQHFINYGVNELRQANENFDIVSYFVSNPDLRQKYRGNMQSYLYHYINHGPEDGRIATGIQDPAAFAEAYLELRPEVEQKAVRLLKDVGGDIYSAYLWCVWIPYEVLPLDWSVESYALYAYDYESGNCLAKASAFYYMARELGYNAYVVYGYVPLDNGGYSTHGWVEIDGYVYDPDFEYETGLNGFQIWYGAPDTWYYLGYTYLNLY